MSERAWKIARVLQKEGFKFAAVEGSGTNDHASWWSFYDEQEVRDRWWKPAKGDVVLDVGAAFGSYALPALAAGARVVCFNPAQFDAELLAENLVLNPQLAKRCLLVRDGIHEADGAFCPDHSVLEPTSSIGRRCCSKVDFRTDDPPTCGWLSVRTLDSWLAERPGIDRVDWVKLDVEGAELGALRGAEQMLRRWRPRLLVELHEFHRPTMAADVMAYLDGLGVGYKVEGPVKHCAVSHAMYSVK